jgi:hypothetical protein
VFLSKIGLWRCRIEKVSKMTPKSPCTLRALFRNSREGRGFRTFNWIGGKISEKAFFDVLEKFSLLRFPAGGVGIHFMGRKSELRFFRKVRNTFSVLGPILLLYSRKSVRTKMTTPTDYPIGCCGSFLTLFLFRFPAVKWRQKKVNGFAVLWDMKEEEVDVIPGLPFSKTRFPRF